VITNRALLIALTSVAILAIIVGAILYLASYFFGVLILLGAILLLLYARREGDLKKLIQHDIISFLKAALIPATGIVSAFVIGAILMVIAKYDPFRAYAALFYGGFVRNWSISILNAVPLIFTGLAVAFAFQAGLFNIGAEGQYYIGAMVTAGLGIYLDIPAFLALPIIFIVGGLLSSSYAAVPAYLTVKTGAHEVITTMMLAHVARLLSPLMVRSFGGHTTSPHPLVTYEIVPQLFLPPFEQFIPGAYYRLHTGILIAIVIAILVHVIVNKTAIGFEIRAVGKNRDAARAQGISVGKVYVIALLGSGFLAGLSGVVQVVGLDHRLYENLTAGFGWDGISVALLAKSRPLAVVFTALLWGALSAGGQYMQRNEGIPSAIVEILKGAILFLLVAHHLYANIYKKMKKS